MKSDLSKKILHLASVEILLQLGFEKCTEQSLNILTEVFIYYIQSLIMSIKPIENSEFDVILKKIISDFYNSELYQIKELDNFIDHQKNIIKLITEKFNNEKLSKNTNLLNLLKLLPKNQKLKSIYKSSKKMSYEEEESDQLENKEIVEVELDAFLQKFIDETELINKKENEIEIKEYVFDLGEIIHENKNLKPNFEEIKYRENFIESEEQEFFITEFASVYEFYKEKENG